jgi:nucleoside-diphosphate-sugar epimerase
MTKCVVTGGAGFIGSNIVQQLLRDGHDVCVLDDLSSGYPINLEAFPQVSFIRDSILNVAAVEQVIEGADTVFHLAASVGNKRSIDHPLLDAEINVMGTLKVLQACRKYNVRKIVVSSSAGIYGELKQLPIDESHPIDPDSPYGASKLCAEKMCLAYAKLYELEAIALRYFNVYGVNQRFDEYGNVIPIFVFRMIQGKPITIFGDGEQTRDFVNVADVVQANLRAGASRGVSGAFNIASGTQVTINALAQSIKDIGGFDTNIEYGPPRPGDVRHSLANVNPAKAAFGFDPSVDLTAGLPEYIQWAKQEALRAGETYR